MMHAAAFSGKKELVQLAYDLGLDINARYGQDGVTPLMWEKMLAKPCLFRIARRKKRLGTRQTASKVTCPIF